MVRDAKGDAARLARWVQTPSRQSLRPPCPPCSALTAHGLERGQSRSRPSRGWPSSEGKKLGDVMQPIRVALTGGDCLGAGERAAGGGGAGREPRAIAKSARRQVRRSVGRRAELTRQSGRSGRSSAVIRDRGSCPLVRPVRPVRPVALSASSVLSAQSGIIHSPFPIRLAFTGDINLGTRTLPDGIPPDSGRQTFARSIRCSRVISS